jgi:hypothetical protein
MLAMFDGGRMPQSNSDRAAPASRLTYLPMALEHPGGGEEGT